MLATKYNISFDDFQSLVGLQRLDQIFLSYISQQDFTLYAEYIQARAYPDKIEGASLSDLLIKISFYLDDFLADLFSIEQENLEIKKKKDKFNPFFNFKRKFVQRFAINKYPESQLSSLDHPKIEEQLRLLIGEINDENIVQHYYKWQQNGEQYASNLDVLAQYCSYKVYTGDHSPLFDIPKSYKDNWLLQNKIAKLRSQLKLGFNHRDDSLSPENAYMQAKYCLYCHKRSKDTCRTGMKEKRSESKNGCPLKQKISEMCLVYSQGFSIASLAIIAIDNPLVAATGHRICNDCMKSCIYQKQEPVNIPMVETQILEEVLSLPWGVEIYLLLTRWNPLNIHTPLPQPSTNYNILVAGLGPAGFALSYYLAREGCEVFAIDGLKIVDLPFDANEPIKFWNKIKTPLAQRIPHGFGGVAEYGITSRWDKNNLTLIRLILQRYKNFQMSGNVRLGSNITTAQAFQAGFHHIALCLGAGKPKYSNLPDFFVRGVRPAVDFLMNLQQGGSFMTASRVKLMVRMPAAVIGCGLTAIDSAVELLHYYPVQVERFLSTYEHQKLDLKLLDEEAQIIAKEFIQHAKWLREAKSAKEKLQIINEKIGGVTVCYRRELTSSSAYLLNHEEIEHAMAVGVKFAEHFEVKNIETDQFNYARKIISSDSRELLARTVLVAIGMNQNAFTDIISNNNLLDDLFINKEKNMSYLGDCNQKYAGSVVKALASAKDNYMQIKQQIVTHSPSKLSLKPDDLQSSLISSKLHSSKILELEILSPFAARNFRPGQFFKLQNYSSQPGKIIKPMALTGISADARKGTIKLYVFYDWNIQNIQQNLQPGENIALMGPIGQPFPLIKGKRILLIAEDYSNLLLLPILQHLRKNSCLVTLLGHYNHQEHLAMQNELEAATDNLIYSLPFAAKDAGQILSDPSLKSNLSKAKKFGLIKEFDQVIIHASQNTTQELMINKKELFGRAPVISFVQSSMQCMMKGICGQCIKKADNNLGYIFSCQSHFLQSD